MLCNAPAVNAPLPKSSVDVLAVNTATEYEITVPTALPQMPSPTAEVVDSSALKSAEVTERHSASQDTPQHLAKMSSKLDDSTFFDLDFNNTSEYNKNDVVIDEKISTIEAEVAQQQQHVNNVAKPPQLRCIHADWAGKRHPETNVLYVERIVTIDGQQYIVVAPEFDSVFDAQLPENLRYASDDIQFRRCTYQLRDALEINPQLKAQFTDKQLREINRGTTPKGYTWHHDVEVGKMQLVLTSIHSKTGHTGGRSLWGGGSKYR